MSPVESPDSLLSCGFRIQFIHSTFTELWIQYVVSSFKVIFSLLAINCTTSTMNADPMSDPMVMRIPKWGIISFKMNQATSDTFSVWVVKLSTQTKKVHTNANKYL